MPSLAFIVLLVVIGLLVLIPTRRLFIAGWSSGALTAYFLAVLALGLVAAELRGPARYLIPVLVVAYIAPFVTTRAGVDRLRGRLGGSPGARGTRTAPRGRPEAAPGPENRPAPKNVTPKDSGSPESSR